MKHTIKGLCLLFCFCLLTSLSAQEVKKEKKVVVVTKVKEGAEQQENASENQGTHVRIFKGSPTSEEGQPQDVRIEMEMEDGHKHITITRIDEAGEEHEIEWEGTGEPPAYIQQYMNRSSKQMKNCQQENVFIFITDDEMETEMSEEMGEEMEVEVKVIVLDESGEELTEDVMLEKEMIVEKQVEVKVIVVDENGEELTEDVMLEVETSETDEDGNVAVSVTASSPETEAAEEQPTLPANLQKGEPLNLSSLEFYPVPTSGKLQLRFSVEKAGPVQINVMDVQGRSVYQEDFKSDVGDYSNEIDLAGNAPGTYFLSIRQGDKLHTERIVLQK